MNVKTDTRMNAVANAKTDTEIDTRMNAETNAKTDTETDTRMNAETNAKTNTETDTRMNAETNAKTDTEMNIRMNAVTDAKTDTKTNTVKNTKTNIKMRICSTLVIFIFLFITTGCENSVKQTPPTIEDETLEDFGTWCMYEPEYLEELKTTYKLDELTKNCNSDYERVQAVTEWVSGLWKHDGVNEPEKDDPLYILDQVVNYGKQYRCVEYGTVICGCLQAIGIDSRIIGLKMKDVETIESGAGHVGCEVFLNDLKKWIFVDGQWGAVPMLDEIPLNAYEFGRAICNDDKNLYINWVNNVYSATDDSYYDWIEPYLFYLDTDYTDADGNVKSIMFVPEDGREVKIFQKKYPIEMDRYLRDIKAFYRAQKDWK